MTTRRGMPWADTEITELLAQISENKTIDEIAVLHERTPGSIRFKLLSMACEQHLKNGRTLEEVQAMTQLTAEEINTAVLKRTEPPLVVTGNTVELKPKMPIIVKKRVDNSSELNEILIDFNRLQGRLARYVNKL